MYTKFAKQFGLSDSLSLPLSVDLVALFIAHLSTKRLVPATISTYISAIITCQTTSSGHSVLQHEDLSFLLHQGEVIAGKLTLTNFKHNRSGHPFYVHILRQPGSAYCPVKALQSFCTLRGSQPGPLFTLAVGSSVSTHHFSQALNHFLVQIALLVWFRGLLFTKALTH